MTRTFRRRIRHAVRGPLVKGLLRLNAGLPLAWSHRLGTWLGRLLATRSKELRHVARINVDLCFPELSRAERAALSRESIIETTKSVTELGPLWLWPTERVMALVREVQGEEVLQSALARGKGIIAVSPHLGAWEMMGVYLSMNYDITFMYKPPRILDLDDLMRKARTRGGARLVATDAGGVRALLQALKRQEMIGVLPDQDPGAGGGEFAPFFGIPANTMTLVSRLAQRSGAPLVLCYAERLPDGRGYVLHFSEGEADIADKDTAKSLRALNRSVEYLVRRCPEQYQWTYRRFRTRPPGLPGVY